MNKNILIILLVLAIAGLSAMLFFSSGQQTVNPPIAEQPTTIPPVDQSEICGIENCHGLDIECGPNPAQMCTAMYQLGDKCRQYARCEISDGTCGLVEDPKFTACKACVEACEKNNSDPMSAFDCESGCE